MRLSKKMMQWLLLLAAVPMAWASDPVPIAPIPVTEYRGWTNAYRLQNEWVTVVVTPDTGRIKHFSWAGQTNLFRVDETLKGMHPSDRERSDWLNFGGDWIWPVAQDRWPKFQAAGSWPPSRLLDGRPWTGRAWRTEDGNQHALITQDYGEPLFIRVTRSIRVALDQPGMRVRQRLERTAASDIPVTLWQLAQLPDAEYVLAPVDDSSAHGPNGFVSLGDFPPVPEAAYKRCGNVMVFDPRLGEAHKFGSDSPRAWLAFVKGDTVMLLRAEAGQGDGTYPDQGSTVTVYSGRDSGYVEMETLSVEQVLAEGDYLDNTLHYSLYRADPVPSSPCAWAVYVQELLGEAAVIEIADE